jgi:hypothetical protein
MQFHLSADTGKKNLLTENHRNSRVPWEFAYPPARFHVDRERIETATAKGAEIK